MAYLRKALTIAAASVLLPLVVEAQPASKTSNFFYCQSSQYGPDKSDTYFTGVLQSPYKLDENAGSHTGLYYERYLLKEYIWAQGGGTTCSRSFPTRAAAEAALAAHRKSASDRYEVTKQVKIADGYKILPPGNIRPWTGPTDAQWESLLAIRPDLAGGKANDGSFRTADASTSQIRVAPADGTSSANERQKAVAEASAAQRTRNARATADANARAATERAKTKARQAARRAAFLKRCPSGKCQ